MTVRLESFQDPIYLPMKFTKAKHDDLAFLNEGPCKEIGKDRKEK